MGILSRLFPVRENAAQRAEWLDSTVRQVAAQVHQGMLADLRQARRNFEAAETPAWTESWSTTEVDINDALSRQLPTLWSRAAGLARNNEWAQAYLIGLDDNVLGPNGITLQMRLTGRDGKPDKAANLAVESAWSLWGERDADVSGLSWAEVEDIVLQTLAKRGEVAYRFVRGAGPFDFQIQLLDPTLIDVNLHRDYQGRRIRMGKEIDDAGKPVAYWLQIAKAGDAPGGYVTVGRHVRIPTSEMRHFYLVEEVGQMRGIPWLTVGARRLWLLHDFEEAAAVASSNAAKRQGFFYTPTGEAPPGIADKVISSVLDAAKAAGKVLTPEEIQAITAAAEKYTSTVPGQFDTLPHGTQFQAFESAWPNIEAGVYAKQQIRGFAAGRGVSYVTMGNDLEAVNYSSAQVGIIGEREHHKKTQRRLRDWLHREVFAAALPYLILHTSALKASRRAEYLAAATWQPRRWAPIDPLKAANAAEVNLRLKLTSRRRLILERGEDPDEIAAEVAAEDALYGEIKPGTPQGAEPADESTPAKRLRLAASRSHDHA